MKTITNKKRPQHSTRVALALACGSLVAVTAATSFADRGRGSIRAAARPAPEARQPEVRQAPARAPEVRAEPARSPQVRHDVVARPAPARSDWDAGDEDARHYGGFAHAAPERVFRGTRVRVLPDSRRDIVWHNEHYFFDAAGAYYLAQPDGQYLVVQPPVGVVVPALPDGTTPIEVGPTTFYYLDGVYYVADGSAFAVVNPPAGIIVPALPSGATQVIIGGTVVYQLNGFNYTPTIQGGVTAYLVTPS